MALNRGFEYRERIGDQADGLSVLTYLSRTYRHSTKEEWRERLQRGEIFLDGAQLRDDAVLRRGGLLVWRRPPWNEPDSPLDYAILHEDADLIATLKPRGLPTVPGGGFLDRTLLALVRKRYPEAVPVHRLGRGSSGIVLFARNHHSRSSLCAAFRRREATRVYRALASGLAELNAFSIDTPIGSVPHPRLGTIHAACPHGKHALSHVRVLERRRDASVLEVRIETGKPHQIRIHLAFAGHPLVGDPLYISGGGFDESGTALPGDCGYLLHAGSIAVPHPATGKLLRISCPPPPRLRTSEEMKVKR